MKLKYHILISCIALAGLALLAYTKKSEVVKSIHWSERLLRWDDFPIIDDIPGDYHAMVYSNIQFEGNRDDKSLRIFAQMIPHLSGRVIEDETDMEQLLIHEQNHFNITEYYARLFRKEVISIGEENLTNSDLQRLGKKYLEKINVMQDVYDRESKHNTEWQKQRYWELHIAGLLRETAYFAEENLYHYQDFLEEETQWYREIYTTLDGELLSFYPENTKNSRFGEVYHITRKKDSILIKYFKNGKPTAGGYYEAPLCIITFPNTATREVHLFDSNGAPFSSKTEVPITRNITDKDGNLIRTYYDAKGKQISKEGVFTQKGIWNDAQKSMYSSYYDEHGNHVTRRGAFYELREMGSNKFSKRISYFDKGGKPMRDKYFISTYEYETDANLMITTAKWFDVDGAYAIYAEGYSSVYDYDARGKIKSIAYLDSLGNKTVDANGVQKYTYSYDQYGNCTDLRKFNVRGLPTKGQDAFHHSVVLIDSLERVTFSAKYDPGYVLKFTENKVGATAYIYEGDSIINIKNVDAYGDEGPDDTGVSLTKQFLNAQKNIVDEQFFDVKGSWAKTPSGVVSYKYKYDERGNQIEMTAFDSLGKIRAWEEDVAISRWEYDKNNNRIKTIYFTENNELANAVQGASTLGFKYDENNNFIERTNYDKNNKPCLFDGAYRTTSILNRFGNDSIVIMYAVNNQIINGAGIIKYDYNPREILISERSFNRNNQAILNEAGVHKIVYEHDKFDRYTGYSYYGKNGEKVNNIEGISTMEINLNFSGYIRSYAYYDKYKNPVIGPEGVHSVQNHYNDMDEVVRTSTYGTDQKLMNNEEGVADFVYQIDESGRTLRISLYNADGDLVEDSQGIAEYFYFPTLNGLFYLEKQLNAQGEEITIEEI